MSVRFQTRILGFFLAATACVGLLAGLTWKVEVDAAQATRWVAQSHEALTHLVRVRSDTILVELSTQNFRLTGNPAMLAERDAAMASREALMVPLQQLADTPDQQQQWRRLRAVIDERIAISRRIEALRKTQGLEAANAYAATAPLQETRRNTYALLDQLDHQARQQLALHTSEQADARRRVMVLGALLSLVIAVVLTATYGLIRRQWHTLELGRRQLAASEANLATTLHSIGDAVLATDNQGRITRMNGVAEQLTGWSQAEALGRPAGDVLRLLQADTRAPVEVPVNQVLAQGSRQDLPGDVLLVARDGREIPIADSAAPIRDGAQAGVQGVVIVFRDDSLARQAQAMIRDQNRQLEQRVAERTQALRESQDHLRSVINSVPALIAYVDKHQRYGYVNAQYLERFGAGRSELTGLAVRDILSEAHYAEALPLIAGVLEGQPQAYDWEPSPGVWQGIHYLPKWGSDGQVDGYYVLGTDITARRQMEDALRASQQQLSRVIEGSDQGYWEWNLQTDEFQVSARWETMLGYAPGEMRVGTEHWPELVHPDDLPWVQELIRHHIAGASESHEAELRIKTKSGDWKWILTRGRIVKRTPEGLPLIMSGTHTDVTERKALELAQREASVVFDKTYEGIMVTDAQGLITKVNPSFTRITGYEEAEVLGASPRLLSSGRHDAAFYEAFWRALTTQDFWRGEIWNQRKNGEIYAVLQSISVVRDAQGTLLHYISVFTDISQIKAHEVELGHVANYDALTDLPNRRLLSDRLRQSIARSDRSGKISAVCFLDLDGFKVINDQHGHTVGDALLVCVSQHLTAILRSNDTLARLGGDEFVLLLSDVGSTQECALILDRVLQAVRQPVQVQGQMLHISASIGVSLYPDDNADPDTLLRHADQAMYLAKQAGKNRYQMFDPEIDRVTQARREVLQQLRAALDHAEFVLYYQPKVDLHDGTVIGAEALVRWQHTERGLLSPAAFLSHLSGSELEVPFGEWVIETALAQMERWRQDGHPISVSVNISANHLLQPGFRAHLQAALSRHSAVPADELELEVLETAAIGDMQQAVAILHECMGLGIRFSLDDFGTGYSSLTYLRQLPVHTLKIDQSFVRDMLTDPDDCAIVQGVIELAAVFHRDVIAEGVETLAHGAALRQRGCRYAQGYGIARPMPADQLPDWCARWTHERAWQHL